MDEKTAEDPLDVDLDLVLETEPPPGLNLADLRDLIPFVLRSEAAAGRWTVAVALVADERLRELHRDFMCLDTPTDVMTFPADTEGPGSGQVRGGDLVVSVSRAAEQAPDYGHTAADEVRFLVVHGLLHLCGWDDASDADRARMLARQAELLSSFDDLTARGGPA